MTSHLIVGGGPAATNALQTIRIYDPDAEITLVCDEPAHSRMALPYWIAGNIPAEQTHTADDAFFARHNVTTHIGKRVEKIEPAANQVTLCDGSTVGYDNLLIATGSSPVAPPINGTDLPGVQPLWSLANTQALLDSTAETAQPRVVMVGAGFIGFIVLNAMYKRGWKLTVVERETQVLPRMLDGGSAGMVQNWLATRGVEVHTGTTVTEIRAGDDGAKLVDLENGTTLEADIVIIATGIQANLGLLDGSGIETDQGILVNNQMQTNFPNIYAAGDVAQGPSLFGSDKEVHAIQPTAVDHGRVAGANMAGQQVQYGGSLLMNVVDVCGLQTASYGAWNDESAELMTIDNDSGFVYRKLLWTGDQITGAIFAGRANDMGMLTDVGMVKGLIQTKTSLGPWKDFLAKNPFDIRRAYVASGVAQVLAKTTLLGQPSQTRDYRYKDTAVVANMGQAHKVYVETKN